MPMQRRIMTLVGSFLCLTPLLVSASKPKFCPPSPEDTPLVLIHGLHDDPGVWDDVVGYFVKNGYGGGIVWFVLEYH